MKILTNKTISSFLSKLTLDSIPVHEKVEKIQFVVQFIDWLTDNKELSPGDAIRFRNELYKKKRELSYKQAPKLSLPLKYVGFSLGVLSLLLVVGGIYIRFFRNTNTPFAYSTAPVQAGRTISFQGRLTDSLGNPINAPIDITYNFYTAPTGGTPITGSTRVCTAGPDQDGVFSSLIGNDSGPSCNTELPNSIFTENTTVYLGVTVGTEPSEMTPRQQIANVGYAINSETLQGMPPGQSVSNVPFINQDGNMLIGASNPGIRSTYASSNFTISSAQATTIQSAGSGDITLSASEGGSLRFKAYNGTLEEVMTILNTGRVGIGITTPRALLDVNGDATVSGSLIAGGQIKIGEFTSPPTNLGNGSLYYDSNTNKVYFWNGTAWTDMGAGATQYFQRTLGSLAPTNITDDLNIGAVATGSAIVHLPGLTNNDVWFNLGTGKVGIGDTTPLSLFTVGNGDLFQVDSTGRIVALDGVAHTIDDVTGNLTLTSNSNTISLNDNVTFAGTTTLNSQAYTWPGTITNGHILQTNGTGTLSWVDPIGLVGGVNLWSLTNGSLYPVNTTLDLFVGGTSTASAKFAFINSNSGTPTASISGTTANVNTFIDGNGNISTTNRTSLVLGNSGTYNSTGNILLNPNGAGNVGIGATIPNYKLDVRDADSVTNGQHYVSIFSNSSQNAGVVSGWYANGSAVTGGLFRSIGALPLYIGTSTSPQAMTVLDNGDVGIGSTTPTARLDIAGSSSSSGTLAFRGTTNPKIDVLNGENLGFRTSVGGDVGLTERMTILNNGNVGIGTTTPTAKLEVIGDASSSGSLVLRGTNPSTIDVLNGNRLDFQTSPGGDAGLLAKLTLTSDGNVGIGTTSPSELLSLHGSSTLSRVNFTHSGTGVGSGDGALFGLNGSNFYFWNRENGNNYFGTNDAGVMTINDSGGISIGSTYYSSDPGQNNLIIEGNVGIGNPSPTSKLDVNGNLNVSTYATISASLALGASNAAAGPGNLSMSGNLLTDGSVTFSSLPTGIVRSTSGLLSSSAINLASGDVTGLLSSTNGGTGADNSTAAQYSVPYYSSTGVLGGILTPGSLGYVLSTNGVGGAPTWINASGVGTNYWNITNGAIYPTNSTLDAFIGGTASASAKFAFLNVDSGTPTASISGTTANVNTFIDGNGNIGTTNRTSLVLGNSGTYDSTGNILLNPNGTGNVGIGNTNPAQALDVSGNVQWGLSGNNGVLGWATGWATVRGHTGEGLSLGSNNTIDQLVIDTAGNVGIGITTPTAKLDVVGNATISGDLMAGGQLQIGRFGYEPSAVGVGSLYFNTANNTPYYHNGTSWTAFSSGSVNYWNISNGAIYPINSTLDMFIGGTASASAKFAFLNVDGGTPTASVAGSLANVATYLTGDGNLSTTNMAALTVGGTSTGSIQLSPKGTTGLFVDGGGNVGVGDTTPNSLFTVGSGDLFQINSTGQIGAQQAPLSDYLFSLAGTTGNDNSRIIDITQANDAAEDSSGIYLVSTANPGTVTTSTTRNIRGLFSSLTPTVTSTGTAGLPEVNIVGNDQSINLNNTTLGDSSFNSAVLATYGNKVDITGTPVINNTDATFDQAYQRVYGTKNTLTLTPTLTATNDVVGTYFGTNNTVSITSGGQIGYNPFVYGTYNNVYGDLSTTGTTSHFGEYMLVSGIADNNYGLFIGGVSQATNNYGISIYNIASSATNYSLYSDAAAQSYFAGSVGIGNLTPTYKLDVTGDINLTGALRANGDAGTTGYILTSAGGGVNTWTDPLTLGGGSNLWTITNGALYPMNATVDAFIGGTASASAKFAFLNVNSGTPTASIAGSLANVATYLTGDGNLATTNMAALTVGGASTGSIQLSPKGTTGLFVDGTGNVGVGDTTPNSLFTVGTGDLFQINSAGQIGAQQAPLSDYLFSLAGTTGNDNSRIIDITQANNTDEDSSVINIVNTSNVGTIAGARTVRGITNTLTPTANAVGRTISTEGINNSLDLSGIVLGDTALGMSRIGAYGSRNTLSGTTTFNDTDGGDSTSFVGVGVSSSIIVNPTLTSLVGGGIFTTYGALFDNSAASAGDASLTSTAYGLRASATGNLTTTGNTTHYGGVFNVSGTADNNTGVYIEGVSSATNNYGLYINSVAAASTNYSVYSGAAAQSYFAGNVGIGNLTPTYKLDVTGDINLTGALRANGNAGTTGYILTSAGGGVNTWTDPASLITGGESLWTILNGALYPTNATVDAFIGGTASASAKFAFLNVNSGTPTASISGTTANVNTFIDGNGNIGTTNRKTLTIGNSTTYNTTGNVLINPNAASNVGIGTIDPQTLFHVQQAAVTSTAEEIARFNISDDATAYFSLRNGSTTDGLFSPQMRFRGSGSTTAGNIQAMITTDTGTSPALVFTSQLASSALVTRPVLAIRNYTTDLMTVLANGSVGIGTTSPLAALDIRKTSGTTPVASISGATSKSTLVVDQSGVGDIMTASSSGQTRFVVKNNGNVGIGYTNPTYKLAVNGSILGDILYDTTNPAYYVDPSGDSVFGGGLSLVGGFTAASASVSGSLTMGYGGQLKSAYGPVNLAYKSGLDSWTTGLVLQDTTGNVGIGTIAPVADLHVFSATNAQMLLETGANANATFNIFEDGGASDHGAALSLDGTNNVVSWQSVLSGVGTNVLSIPYAGSYANRIGINTTTPLASLDLRSMLGTIPVASISGNTSQAALIVDQSGVGDIFTASSSGETRFVIKSNGNVGIGVADPTGKLSIAGTSSTISNLSGDIILDSASGNISFSNDNLINVANIASIGQIQIGGFASPPTSIGNGAMYYDTTNNKVFYWDGTIWSEMGSKYWQRTLGSLSPQYITDALNLGAIASGSALVHLPGTNNQDAWFNLGTGTVGIGTTTPDPGGYGYKLDVSGTMVADKYVDSASNSYYVDPAGDSVLGGNVTLGDIFMIDGTPLISSLNAGSYSTITIKGSGDTTTASLCVDEGTGTSCDGKINAGTIDPPYTINGKKYATYLPSMTGVKEETTGKIILTERNEEAKAYIKRIALGNQPEDSDLWLFAKATNLKDQIREMTVLLSSNTNGKTWYSVDPATMVLTFYSSTPSEVSYRLTAPRFDAGRWANTRHENDFGTGFILNDRGNILAGDAPTYTAPKIISHGSVFTLIGNFIEEFTASNQALFANITAGIVTSQKIVSPLAEIDTLNVNNKIQSKEINTELLKASNSIEAPRLNTNVIDIGTQSGQLAKLVINGLYNNPVVTIDSEGSATFAGTLTADAIQTQDASISGTLIAKEIQSETIDALSTQLASNSSTLASSYQTLSGDINAVQQELAALRTTPLPNASYYQNLDATYNSLSITDTANIYKAYISDSLVVGSLFMEDHSILALASDLSISSLGTITFFDGSVVMAKNGNITSKGEVTAASLAIKNEAGITVAEIDASGSARFNEVVAKKFSLESIATQGALIADSGVVNNINVPIPAIKTNAEVAGTGAVPQDVKEVIIYNDNVTEDSLIYLTPTSDNTQGQLSVSKKVTCAQNSALPCTPYFIVSSSLLIHTETPFNWLIIN